MKKPIHILHIDDDKFILDIYKPLLENEGYKVATILTPYKDLIAQITKINPELIICDVVMPVIDGIAILKSLKADNQTKDIPFVFLTNSAEQETREEALQLGAIDYLIKAKLRPMEVVEKIKNLCINLVKN